MLWHYSATMMGYLAEVACSGLVWMNKEPRFKWPRFVCFVADAGLACPGKASLPQPQAGGN